MKRSLQLSVLVLLILTKNNSGFSQQIKFNKVVSPIGSFSGFVGGMVQDKNGFMWFATGAGLYKYDGYRFKTYTNDPSNNNSLSTNRLETVYADLNGIIWILTWVNGLDRLDPVTGKFTHFHHNPNNSQSLSNDTVRAVLQDHEGVLWIGTQGGLDRYDPKTGKFQNYHHEPNDSFSLSCNRVRKIYEDKEGTLWIGTGSIWLGEGGETDEGGLNRFNKKTGKFVRYMHNPANPHSLINNKVQAIFEDSRGVFWVGTAGDGLHTMNRATGKFERHSYDPTHPEGLSRPPVNDETGFIDHITFIKEDAVGSIWIGTLGNGLNRYNPKAQRTVHYGYKDTAIGFTDNSGWSSCNSRDGILWISSYEGGLYRIDPFHTNIQHVSMGSNVNAFNEDPVNGFWIGTNQGLIFPSIITGTSKKFIQEASNPTSLENTMINSLHRDSEGTLWIGTRTGLNRFNAQSLTFTRFQNSSNNPNSIIAGKVFAIEDAGRDSLWIGTDNGLDLMDKHAGTFIHFRNIPGDTNSLFRNDISSLVVDKSGNVWVGIINGGGLDFLDRRKRIFRHYSKGISVFSLLLDSHGILWVGTDAGLYKSNGLVNGFTKFTDPGSGIESTTIFTIQEDNQGNLWISASSGIYKINPRNNQSNIFGENYGVSASSLSLFAHYKDAQGKIYFGDANGYYVFLPEELIRNSAPPQIALTDFRIGGKSVLPGEKSPLTSPLLDTKEIWLNYNQNLFSFDFACIHFSNPEQNRQFYKLENYDLDWRGSGTEKTAYYYNVPPGHYVFKVKGASSEGIWTERDLAITILAPWWRTWWAYTLYGLLFIGSVFVTHSVQKRRIINKERERTREKELVQAKEIEKAYHELKLTQAQLIQSEKMASLGELTAGIAHEIQNPLNFVNNFSEVSIELVDELKNEAREGNKEEVITIANDIAGNLQKVVTHGKRADSIVKSMMEHSRTSKGEMQPTDINVLADEYLRLAYHGMRGKDKSFNATLETHFDETINKIKVVPQDIGRVLLNLYNNAFYAVAEKKKQSANEYSPTISVNTTKENDKVIITVSDNGIGISEKVKDKIFQPFFTTKPTGQGTGLGLSLAYDIIKAHGGEIRVETKEGEFTEFIINLPIV